MWIFLYILEGMEYTPGSDLISLVVIINYVLLLIINIIININTNYK